MEKTLWNTIPIIQVSVVLPNFMEKTFVGGSQTAKLVKVSPSKLPAIGSDVANMYMYTYRHYPYLEFVLRAVL